MEAVDVVIEVVRKLTAEGNLKDAFDLLEEKFSPLSQDIADSILLNKAVFQALQKERRMGLITDGNVSVRQNRIMYNVLQIMQQIPEEMALKKSLGNVRQGLYTSTSEDNLEKIMGSRNHLLKINWLSRGIRASRSVCQVVRSDGEKGTGFVLQGGYLMTNFHVLPSRDIIKKSKVVFDFEEDLLGNQRKTSQFFLDPDDVSLSPVEELDYAYVKIRDNQSNPLTQWDHLEPDTFSDPQVDDPVTIIQHPLGETKQIALTANTIIGLKDDRVWYLTDTERGSSGSPVFNSDWKVIALHHAGKTEKEGGYVIHPETGERKGANEGILMKAIMRHNTRIH
jgi:V8-like Glu-specific endopeptidase